jgi:1-acyl-sn-glycerol-3-phosphate acyltransferase plsC3
MRKWLGIACRGAGFFIGAHHHCRKGVKHLEKTNLFDRIHYIQGKAKIACDKYLKIQFIISGSENLIEGQKLYVGNHTSLIDPVLFMAINDDPVTVVAKKEISATPFFKTFASYVECPFVDRSDLRSEIRVFRKLNDMIETNRGLSVLIYPEGTRSKETDFPLLPFHPGTFKVATRQDLPICPFVMYLPERTIDPQFHYKVYPIQVAYLKPMMPEEYRTLTNQEIADRLHARMEVALNEMKAREEMYVQRYNGYSKEKTTKVLTYKKDSRTY